MYLLQQTTKQPTDEILGFFYDFGKEILSIGIDNMTDNQRSIRKDIQDTYPGTNIPFKILVTARKFREWQSKTYVLHDAQIAVGFPENSLHIDTTKMMEVLIERQLLGGSSLPDFEKPKSRTPKMYKELIDKVVKGNKS